MRGPIRVLFGLALGGLILVRADAASGQTNPYSLPQSADPSPLECIEGGKNQTLLDENDLLRLCTEASSAAPVACFNLGRDKTLLSEDDLMVLCEAAVSTAPIDCFRSARDQTLIDNQRAIELCRCATTLAPVSCYERGDAQGDFDQEELVSLCSPSALYHLGPGCRPYAGYSANPPPRSAPMQTLAAE